MFIVKKMQIGIKLASIKLTSRKKSVRCTDKVYPGR